MVRIARTGVVVVLSKMRPETIMAQLLRPSFPPPFLVYLGPGSEPLLELLSSSRKSIPTNPRTSNRILVPPCQ